MLADSLGLGMRFARTRHLWQILARTAVSMAFLPALELPGADWPRLGGPNGLNVSPETGLARSWPANGPRVLWTVPVGRGFGGAAIRDDCLFLLDRQGKESDLLRCLSLADGHELWRLVQAAPGTLPYDGSRNVPTVDERFVFAVGPFGHFSCVDRQTHQLVWRHHLVDEFKDPEIDRPEAPTNRLDQLARAQVPTWGMTQAPLCYRNLVIVAPQTQKVGLIACDKASGEVRWKSGYLGRNWYSHVSPVLMRFGGVDQVIMLAQPSDPEKAPSQAPPAIVSSVDPNTGRLLWQTKTPGPHKIPIALPIQVGEDRLLVTGGYGLGCVAFEVRQTNGRWEPKLLFQKKTAAAHIHSPILYQDRIYVSSFKEQGGAKTGLVCLGQDAEPVWQTGPELQFFDGSVIIADGMALVMNGKTGVLHLIELGATGFKLLGAAKVIDGSNLWAPMALSDGKLIVRDHLQLKCLDLKKP